jgi:hypothetical protein
MDIKKFAEQYRVKTSKDVYDDTVIVGRLDESNIYEYSDTKLGVMFCTDGNKPPRTQLWNTFKTNCLISGMTLVQEGDAEGAFSFDGGDKTQAKVAIKGIRARVKKQLKPELIAAMTARLAKSRADRAVRV